MEQKGTWVVLKNANFGENREMEDFECVIVRKGENLWGFGEGLRYDLLSNEVVEKVISFGGFVE